MADIPQLLPTSLALIVVLGLAYRLALAHAAMSAVSRTRLRSLAEDGVRRAERLGALLARRDGVQASLRLGFSLCVVAAAVAGWWLARLLEPTGVEPVVVGRKRMRPNRSANWSTPRRSARRSAAGSPIFWSSRIRPWRRSWCRGSTWSESRPRRR